MENEKRLIIYKKVAKQGSQAVIVIPRLLEKKLKPGTLTRLTIDILEDEGDEIK
jgi:hypothetical protein